MFSFLRKGKSVCSISDANPGEPMLMYRFERGVGGGQRKLGSLPVREIRSVALDRRKASDGPEGAVWIDLVAEVVGSGDARSIVMDTFTSEADAEHAHGCVQKILSRRPRTVKVSMGAALVLSLTGLVLIGLMLERPAPSAIAAAPSAPEVAAAPQQGGPDVLEVQRFIAGEPAPDVAWSDMTGVKGLNHITFGDGPPEFYVFSDPRCGACQMFEYVLDQAKAAGRSFAIIPVATQGNGSAVLAAQSLCAPPTEQGAAWGKVIRGEQVVPVNPDLEHLQSCAQATLDNLKYFMDHKPGGRAATPTIMTADGRTRIGAFSSIEELTAWISK